MTVLKTTSKHVALPHRLFWQIVQEQAQMARERKSEPGWSHPAVVALTFASHAIEAYLNCVGERLAPFCSRFFEGGHYAHMVTRMHVLVAPAA